MRKTFIMVAGFLILALAGVPASAASMWSVNGESEVTDYRTVTLKGTNTSVETGNLGINVDAGAEVSFTYELSEGATCSGGAPRVFMAVNGTFTNSWDGNPGQCGTDGMVTFTLPQAGLITQTGIVYDNGVGGVVTITDLTVDGKAVDFLPRPTEDPSPEPSENVSPSPDPTTSPSGSPEPSESPSASPSAVPSDSPSPVAVNEATLPKTSGVAAWLFLAGAGAIAAGGIALLLSRKSKATFKA